jgi:hypothetical protein
MGMSQTPADVEELRKLVVRILTVRQTEYLPKRWRSQSAIPKEVFDKAHRRMIKEQVRVLGTFIQAHTEDAERRAEDKSLDYARTFVDLFKDRPDQVEYVLRHLNGERYRKDHKGVKVELRKALNTPDTAEDHQQGVENDG